VVVAEGWDGCGNSLQEDKKKKLAESIDASFP
jgi:hypothetical protein